MGFQIAYTHTHQNTPHLYSYEIITSVCAFMSLYYRIYRLRDSIESIWNKQIKMNVYNLVLCAAIFFSLTLFNQSRMELYWRQIKKRTTTRKSIKLLVV